MGNRHNPQQQNKMYDVFISHKSKDSHAFAVYEFLREKGVKVFFSDRSLPELRNAEFQKQIVSALDSATGIRVLCTGAQYAKSGQA